MTLKQGLINRISNYRIDIEENKHEMSEFEKGKLWGKIELAENILSELPEPKE